MQRLGWIFAVVLPLLGACSDPDGLPFGGGDGEGGSDPTGGVGATGNGSSTGGVGVGAGGSAPATCGDTVCGAAETCGNCPSDCGACTAACGNAACEAGESCQSCPSDCGGCCAHDKCAAGEKLTPDCDPCVAQICATDPYCCDTTWDSQCIGEVASICGITCGGGGCGDGACNGGETCSSCAQDCGPCASCGDGTCQATESCSTCATDCGNCGTCSHSPCTLGGPLAESCSPCVSSVCLTFPTCCTTSWTQDCVLIATLTCTPCV